MNDITIAFKPTERFRRAQMLNHAIPGILLLLTGIDALMGETSNHMWNPWLNCIAGGAVITTIIYEFRFAKHQSHKLVNWVDIFAGTVLAVEGINHLHPGGWFQPGSFYIVTGTVIAIKGLLHSRIPQIRRMVISENGLTAKISLIQSLAMNWNDISFIDRVKNKIRFRMKDGKLHIMSLRRVENKEEVITTLKRFTALKQIERDL